MVAGVTLMVERPSAAWPTHGEMDVSVTSTSIAFLFCSLNVLYLKRDFYVLTFHGFGQN